MADRRVVGSIVLVADFVVISAAAEVTVQLAVVVEQVQAAVAVAEQALFVAEEQTEVPVEVAGARIGIEVVVSLVAAEAGRAVFAAEVVMGCRLAAALEAELLHFQQPELLFAVLPLKSHPLVSLVLEPPLVYSQEN